MPDHLHFFVRGNEDFNLARWVNGLKRTISVPLGATKKRPLWQPGFFDHILRNDESYSEKWEYVRENPVRAGLVMRADQWPTKANLCSSIGRNCLRPTRPPPHGDCYTQQTCVRRDWFQLPVLQMGRH
jgi:hypothetical protein